MTFAVLLVIGIGIAYLIPPYEAVKFCGPSGYLAVPASALLIVPLILLLIALERRFPHDNLLIAAEKVFGKFLGKVGNLLFLFLLIGYIIFGTRNAAELISTYLLDATPNWAVICLILTSSGLLAFNGLVGVSRLAGFIFIPTIAFRLLMLLVATQGLEWDHLLPVFSAQPLDYLKAGSTLVVIYAPWLISLFFIYPLLSKPQKLKPICFGLLGVQALLLFLSVAIMIGVFGVRGVPSYTWPVYEAVRRIDIPLLALNQIGLLFLIVWFTLFLTALAFFLYIYASSLRLIFQSYDYRWWLLGICLLTGAGAIIIPDLFVDVQILTYLRLYALIILYAYPFLVYLGALLGKKGVRRG